MSAVAGAVPRRPPNLRLLGGLSLDGLGADHATRLFGQPKRFALLVYVLLSRSGSTLARDHLLGVFWPESTEDRARNALRQTLSFLRGCLGPDVVLGTGGQGLSVHPSFECDAVRFETLLDRGETERALGEYRGELLPGFHAKGVGDFQDWLDRRRQQLGQRAAKAAWDLSAEYEGAQDLRNAAFWGKRALALSPFSESEVQRLLRLLDRVGDGMEAMRTFQGLQRMMRAEFGMEPSRETLRLVERIRERLPSAPSAPSAGATRRVLADRRTTDRRVRQIAHDGPERRGPGDRRRRDRRSGRDRRTP